MRRKAQRLPEQWKDESFSLGGGLDQTASALAIKPGRMLECLNWEENFGKQGYSTIRGYERFSGKPSPSAVEIDQDLLTDVTLPVALTLARTARRDVIAKPVGSGAVLGVVVFNQLIYCVRNTEDGQTATLWKSSATGWEAVKTNLHPGGRYQFAVANFTGSTDTTSLFGVNGRGRGFRVTAAGVFSYLPPIYGSEATSNTSLAIGLGSKAFTLVEPTRSYATGQVITAYDRANPSNFMTGTFVSYAANVLTINVATVGGSGTIAAWELGLSDWADKPFLVTEHKSHLFLGYPKGQLQTSNVGDPLLYTTTATVFGIGDELTELISMKGDVLGVFCRESIHLLAGKSSLDWQLSPHTTGVGAFPGTVQDNAGNAIFLDDKGLTTLQASQNYGDFEGSILSANVRGTFEAYRQLPDGASRIIGSRMAKRGYQYRIYFDDATMLRGTIRSGNPTLTPTDVSFTTQRYAHVPTCFASGVINGVDRMFFGTDDGWVMEEDAGTSFDGAAIYYTFKLPFNHCKSPSIEKRFHKIDLELETLDPVTMRYRQSFNYDDGVYRHGGNQVASSQGRGGLWDVSLWDTFFFDEPTVTRISASLKGVGQNMSLLFFFENDYVRPVTLQGVQLFYSLLGIKR